MSLTQRPHRRAIRQCVNPAANMFVQNQSPFGSVTIPLSAVVSTASTVTPDPEDVCQPPLLTTSRCSMMSATAITRFEKEKVVYTWTILGIKNWPEDKNGITSTSFRHPNLSEWRMVLSKKGSELQLCFWLKASKESVKANLRAVLSLGGGEKREVYPPLFCTLKAGEKSTPKSVSDTFPSTGGYKNMGDSLTFECEVEIMSIVWEELPVLSSPDTQPDLARDFGKLLDSQDFADFVLNVGDVQIKAHKNVLSARSPVFASMLHHDMEEAQKNCANIEGVEPEVVSEALRYMYTGRAPALRNVAQGLLVFADRYDLPQLKSQCEVELARRLAVDNAFAYAVFADVNSCDALLKASVAFIRRHIEAAMGTTAFKDALRSHPASLEKISQLISAGAQSKSNDAAAKGVPVFGSPFSGDSHAP